MNDFWQKQTDRPLFPDLLWSRPETRQARGKLLIIGGQAQEFSHVASAYQAAETAGAGTIRVLVPESLRPITKALPHIEYAPSNPSGSFSRQALAEFFDASAWADHVLLAGDLGKNSETNTLLDGYLLKCPGAVTVTQDALSTIRVPFEQLLRRPCTLVVEFRTIQKIATELSSTTAITSDIPAGKLAEALRKLTIDKSGVLVGQHAGQLWIAHKGHVINIRPSSDNLTEIAASTAVWAMQHPAKPFEAIVTALFKNLSNS